jgi:hypothetical protein
MERQEASSATRQLLVGCALAAETRLGGAPGGTPLYAHD